MGSTTCGFLEWYPYENDRTMGLNHQMASLSCALGEAFYLQRTLLLPDRICLFGLHMKRWKASQGASVAEGDSCVPTTDLFDVERLALVVPATLRGNASLPAFRSENTVRVGKGWTSKLVKDKYACGSQSATLVRRRVDSDFWFQKCTRRQTDHSSMATAVNLLVGGTQDSPKPMNILLRSGLFYSQSIKAAASAIRARIGSAYASVHVRRSDKLTQCSPEECRERDTLTQPGAISKALGLWLPPASHVYIGSTEPPRFFAPLRQTYRMHFAEDFRAELANITNNYALYATETLIFFGSHMSVETYSFQSAWFVDACFPAVSLRGRGKKGMRERSAAAASLGSLASLFSGQPRLGEAETLMQQQRRRGVEIQCRDQSGILINGVLYGHACVANPPCGRHMALSPAPVGCGAPALSERIMLANRSVFRAQRAARRCSALGFDGRRSGSGGGGGAAAAVSGRGKKHGVAKGAGLPGAPEGTLRRARGDAGHTRLDRARDAQIAALQSQLKAKESEIVALRDEVNALRGS